MKRLNGDIRLQSSRVLEREESLGVNGCLPVQGESSKVLP